MVGQNLAQEGTSTDIEMVRDNFMITKNNYHPFVFNHCSREHIELIMVKGEFVFFKQRDGPYLPTLKLLHKCELVLE